MSEFIFKVPRLPEDSILRERKNRLLNKQKEFEKWEKNESIIRKSRQMVEKTIQDRNSLIPIRETDGYMLPSTSRERNGDLSVFQSSFNRNQSAFEIKDRERYNSFKSKGHDFGQNLIGRTISMHENLKSDSFTDRIFRNSINSLDTHLNPTINQSFNRSLYTNRLKRTMNSVDPTEYSRSTELAPSKPLSSLGYSRLGFGTLHQKSTQMENPSMNSNYRSIISSKSNYSKNNGSLMLQHTSIQSNAVQNGDLVMLTMLNTSVKQQVLNALENFGQTFLSNAKSNQQSSSFQLGFDKTMKDVKQIFENSIMFMNETMDNTEVFSGRNYSSAMFSDSRRAIIENSSVPKERHKQPQDLIRYLAPVQNNPNRREKGEFTKSFQVARKNQYEDSFDLEEEDPEISTSKLKTRAQNKEIKLKNWIPVAKGTDLVFTGMNQDNRYEETTAVKRRINYRSMELVSGVRCTLIGKVSTEVKFPEPISSKLTKGLHPYWKVLQKLLFEYTRNTKNTSKDKSRTEKNKKNTGEGSAVADFTPTSSKSKVIHESKKKTPKKSPPKKEVSSSGKKAAKNKSPRKRSSKSLERHQESSSTGKVKSPKRSPKKPDRSLNVSSSPGKQKLSAFGRVLRRPGDLWRRNASEQTLPKSSSSKKEVSKTANNVKKKPEKRKSEVSISEADSSVTETKTKTKSTPSPEAKKRSPLKRKGNVEESTSVTVKKRKCEELDKSSPKSVRTRKTGRSEQKEAAKDKLSAKKSSKVQKKLSSTPLTPKSTSESEKASESPMKQSTWKDDFEDGLDIVIPEITSNTEELLSSRNKLQVSTTETPPLKFFNKNLRLMNSCTPDHSPFWQVSQHSRSAVRTFEQSRAKKFKQKIITGTVETRVVKKVTGTRNKTVDDMVEWISQKEVRSPTQCSKVMSYVMPKRRELEEDEEDYSDRSYC